MLSQPSQLLFRNPDYLEAERILVVNYPADNLFGELKALYPNAHLTAFSSNVAVTSSAQSADEVITQAELPQQNYDLVVLFYPKAKAEAQMLLDNIRAISCDDTRLLVVGENNGGVRSVAKQLKDHCYAGRKVDSARHCSLFQFVQLSKKESFSLTDYYKTFSVTVNQTELKLVTLPGVFSHGELDKGTELLLRTVNLSPKTKTVLDFACGCGVISAYYLKQSPSINLVASDVSALALAATQATLAANNLSAELVLADGIASISQKFDAIVSNPPFHTGLNTDYEITRGFIRDAKTKLAHNGNLAIVANAFLPYPAVLEEQFGAFETLAHNKSFVIYQASAK